MPDSSTPRDLPADLHAAARDGRTLSVDVLVAGAGPCGLMLANELGLRGVGCLLVDPKATTAFNPQANATQARTMEHFRRIGIAAQIRALGLPPDHPTDIAYFTRFATHELARLRLPTAAQATQQIRRMSGSWSAAELPHRVSQKFVEAVLREHAEQRTGQRVGFGWRLQSFDDNGAGVVAQLAPAAGGAAVTVRARYLVGADGARSGVRAALGIGWSGATGQQRHFMGGKMFAVYLRAPDFHQRFPHDPAWMLVSVNPERRVFMASVDGRGEFAFHAAVHPHETPEDWTHEDARRIVAEASGMPDLDLEILSTGIWVAGHSLVAERYRQGRVFIAGDAAHLFTPTGGLGYNTAVGDAVNLGWKLAAVVKGQAHASLLETYETERQLVGRRNTAYARGFADSVGLFEATPALEADGPEGERARAVASEVLGAHVRREFNIPGVTFGERYDDSPIVFSDPAQVPPDEANAYVPSTNPGGRLPHRWLGGDRSLYDRLGFEWTVIAPPALAPAAQALADAGRTHGLDVALLMLDGPDLADAGDLFDHGLLLVRPDQVVAWRGTDGADADAVWHRAARLAAP